MPLFPLKKIAALATNRQTYLRGISLYNAGRVGQVSIAPDTEYAERLHATVEDPAGVMYTVDAAFSAGGEVLFSDCTCLHREAGACRHLVAALTYKYYHDMVHGGGSPAAEPTTAVGTARRMLNTYFQSAQAAIRATGEERPVQLIPTLTLNNPPTLMLSVARDPSHAYVIKDVDRFCAQVAAGETVSYGAQLTFPHDPEMFAPESRSLLALVRCGRPGGARREMALTPLQMDRLFSLYENRTVEVQGVPMRFCRENPPLSVTVTHNAAAQTTQFRQEVPRFARGEEGLYLAVGEVLYGATPSFAAAVSPWLAAMRETGGELTLTARELSAFVSGPLKMLEEYVTFSGDVACFDPYRPQKPEAAVYLDIPDPHTVTARVEFRYGAAVYPLIPGDPAAAESDRAGRDVLAEWQVQLAVSNAFPERQESLFVRHCTDEWLFSFLTDELPSLSRLATVYTSEAFRTVRVSPPSLSVGVRLSGDLLNLSVDTGEWEAQELDALLQSYRLRRRYHRLKSGAFLSLDDPALRGFARLMEGLGVSERQWVSGQIAVPAYRAPFVDRVLAESRALKSTRDESVRTLLTALKAVEDSPFLPPSTLCGELRRYQRTGFCWLRTLEHYGFGGILADDMGLGKTVQMIALLLDAQARGVKEPSLVVCPASLILNWESELRRFAPGLSVKVIIGDSATRAALIQTVAPGDVVVTSYDLLKRDMAQYAALSFHYQVLDEAQYIKNHATQNARCVKAIRSRRRFALTGTPVENRLSELWSLFDYLMPGFLFSYHRFRERFELPAVRDGDTETLETLAQLCAPFILRRLKSDVLQELPPKTESVRLIPLEDSQQKTYVAAALSMREQLRAGENTTRLQALTMLTRLRQICCDPSLCFENYRGASTKRAVALEMITEAVETGHRVLLFSQFTSLLALLQQDLQKAGIPFYVLQGSTSKEARAAMVEAFNGEGGAPVFLISLKAGGTGLNLTAADVVIHYDPWWNRSVQNQATDRAHRIGQQRPVQVYRLIAKGTVEEKILTLQETKQSLADAVVRADDMIPAALTDAQLLELLSVEGLDNSDGV